MRCEEAYRHAHKGLLALFDVSHLSDCSVTDYSPGIRLSKGLRGEWSICRFDSTWCDVQEDDEVKFRSMKQKMRRGAESTLTNLARLSLQIIAQPRSFPIRRWSRHLFYSLKLTILPLSSVIVQSHCCCWTMYELWAFVYQAESRFESTIASSGLLLPGLQAKVLISGH